MDVSAQDGIVTLTGMVGSIIMKWVIVDEVSRLAGVRTVQADELYDDTSLQLAVARTLGSNPSTRMARDDQVYIHVYHGRVVLTGRVSSSAKCEAIEEAAAAVPGVRSVVNRLEVARSGLGR
ncbi:MAG TPA: BON domain-containing protein [Chloroflexi bacterium]|nr:BON domain-containing protein [Chloroflexota bacterium]